MRSRRGAGIAKITIARPEVRNAFRPRTVIEMSRAFERRARGQLRGGDRAHRRGPRRVLLRRRPARSRRQRLRRTRARRARWGASTSPTCTCRSAGCRSRSWRWSPGYAIGGGHVLHLVCDLTIAADNARFGQVGPRVGSFDGGFGASLLANLVGPKKAKEIWFLCRQYYAAEALEMGLVNTVVPLERLEEETVGWCREMLAALALRPATAEGELQRGRGRPRGHPAARPRHEPALLRKRGGPGGTGRLHREAPAGLLPFPRRA